MKKRLAKVIAVLLTLAVIVGVLVTVASATGDVATNNLRVGNLSKIASKFVADGNSIKSVETSNGITVDPYRLPTNTVFEVADDYYVRTRTTASSTVTAGNYQYTEFNGTFSTYANGYNFVSIDFDFGADKWVSKDASGLWTVMSDEYTSGARLSYPDNPVFSLNFLSRVYGITVSDNEYKALSYGTGSTNGGLRPIYSENENRWYLYMLGQDSKKYPLPVNAGETIHVTFILDLSETTYTAGKETVVASNGTSYSVTGTVSDLDKAMLHIYLNGEYFNTYNNPYGASGKYTNMKVNTANVQGIRSVLSTSTTANTTYKQQFSFGMAQFAQNGYKGTDDASKDLANLYSENGTPDLTEINVDLVYTDAYTEMNGEEAAEAGEYIPSVFSAQKTGAIYSTYLDKPNYNEALVKDYSYVNKANVTSADGNKYYQLTRQPEVNVSYAAKDNDTYFDVDLGGMDTKAALQNIKSSYANLDYLVYSLDVTTDKWVSKDANEKWTVLSDEPVVGARPAYNAAFQVGLSANRYIAKGATSVSWAGSYGGVRSAVFSYDGDKNVWKLSAGSGSVELPNEIGVWNKITVISDFTKLNFVAYDANGNVVDANNAASAVAYFLLANPGDAKSYVYYNGEYLGVFTTIDTKAVTNATQIKAVQDNSSKVWYPAIFSDVSRTVVPKNTYDNEAFSAGYDNFNVKYYYNSSAIEAALAGGADKADISNIPGISLEVNDRMNNTVLPVVDAVENENSIGTGAVSESGNTNKVVDTANTSWGTVTSTNGNKYYAITRNIGDEKKNLGADLYIGYKPIGGYNQNALAILDYDYAMLDFSFTPTKYVDENGKLTDEETDRAALSESFKINLFYRFTNNYLYTDGSKNDKGNYIYTNGGVTSSLGDFYLMFDYDEEAKTWFIYSNKDTNSRIDIGNDVGVWTNVSFVLDIPRDKVSTEYGTDDSNRPYAIVNGIKGNAKLHVYINGQYLSTVDDYFSRVADGTKIGVDNIDNIMGFGFDGIRMNFASPSSATSDINVNGFAIATDNFYSGYYKNPVNFAGDYTESFYNNPNSSYAQNKVAALYTVTATTTGHIKSVNRVYNNLADALAYIDEISGNAAYSNITLNTPSALYDIDVNNAFAVVNDFNLQWSSDEYKLVDGKFVVADAADVKTITWNNFDGSTRLQKNYAVGSTVQYNGEKVENIALNNRFFDLALDTSNGYYNKFVVADSKTFEANTVIAPNVQAYFNLTTTTSFAAYFYMPWYATGETEIVLDGYTISNIKVYNSAEFSDATDLSKVTQSGKEGTEGYRFKDELIKEIEGANYKPVTSSPGANGNNVIDYWIAFEVNGVTYSQALTYDLVSYFNDILEGKESDAAKSLILHAVEYMRTIMEVVGKDTDATAAFDEILNKEEYAKYFIADVQGDDFADYILANKISNVGNTEVTNYLENLHLVVGTGYRPALVFNAKADAGVKEVNVYYYNRSENKWQSVGTTKSNNSYEVGDTIPLYAYQNKLKVEVITNDGKTVTADYSIMADIFAIGNDANAVKVEKALYAYALASYNYKSQNENVFSIAPKTAE